MTKPIYFLLFLIAITGSSCNEQGNKTTIKGNGNTVIQINFQVDNIETGAPITNGNLILAIDGQQIKEAISADGTVSLPVDTTYKNKPAKLIIQDSLGNVQYTQPFIIPESNNTEKKLNIKPFKRFVIDEVNGDLAQGETRSHSFRLNANTPVLIQTQSQGNLQYSVQIVNTEKEVLKNWGTYRPSESFYENPFTAEKSGEYYVQVKGHYYDGNYKIHVVFVDDKKNFADTTVSINNDQIISDRIAEGSFDDYELDAEKDQTIVVHTKSDPNSNLNYYVMLFNSIGERVINKGSFRGSNRYEEFAFTPPDSSKYILRIYGSRGYGSYDIKYEKLPKPVIANISLGEVKGSTLGNGGQHQYIFNGVQNNSIKVKTMSTPNLRYRVQILNASGEVISNQGVYYPSDKYNEFIFPPPKNGDFIINIIGTNSYGDYKVIIE